MKEYPKCPYIAACSMMVIGGERLSWMCLRLERAVCSVQCEQCERAVMRMIDFQCR